MVKDFFGRRWRPAPHCVMELFCIRQSVLNVLKDGPMIAYENTLRISEKITWDCRSAVASEFPASHVIL